MSRILSGNGEQSVLTFSFLLIIINYFFNYTESYKLNNIRCCRYFTAHLIISFAGDDITVKAIILVTLDYIFCSRLNFII